MSSKSNRIYNLKNLLLKKCNDFLIGLIFPAMIIQSPIYKELGKRSHLIRLKGNHLPAGNLAAPTSSIYLYNLHL